MKRPQRILDWRGRKVTVVGLGKSGFAAARFLAERGAAVRATDASEKQEVLENAGYLRSLGAAVETGRHTEGFVSGSDMLVTSPGVPKHSRPLEAAKRLKIPVISEVELAASFCPASVIAVTGSNGKTTTCHLTHRMLLEAGKRSVLCGNVGYSFLDAAAEITASTVVVLELSSFQLEDSPTFRPDAAAILNISPNHLDRHRTMSAYIRAKCGIFRNQRAKDLLLLNGDDAVTRRLAGRSAARTCLFGSRSPRSGIGVVSDAVVWRTPGRTRTLFRLDRLKLEGKHNLYNAMAAAALASRFGATQKAIEAALSKFRTLEHRIEALGEIAGVRFVNDSKSTTTASTAAAIEAVGRPLILIAGGRDKGASFAALDGRLDKELKAAVLYGESGPKIAASWKRFKRYKLESDFSKAVRAAFEMASPGDTVLLSPMCTSFDQFNSFEHRGEVFKKIFEDLKRTV